MDEESFKRQFLPLHPRLYRIAFTLTENSNDAEDILQELYCKLWDKRGELSHIENPEAFCVTLVKNLCFDFLRSAYNSKRGDIPEQMVITINDTPEKAVIRQDEVQQVGKMIETLPENQRMVIRLRGIEECSMEEIEEITGLSAVNIRVLLSRARKMIRAQLNKVTQYEQQRY
ncbi:MAG: sigma-70 family RNA polymerase sigma factor [Tannerellaceae bacterium]|nr:sigma-70 family RNA polymerase sigma factor [Tannerellaceae bacterium]